MTDDHADPASVILELNDIVVSPTKNAISSLRLLDGVSVQVRRGERVAIVGESGSGKSLTAMTSLGLLGYRRARMVGGQIRVSGEVVDNPKDQAVWRRIRGKEIGLIAQDAAFNPLRSIGSQIEESLELHFPEMQPEQRRRRILELVNSVGLREPERVLQSLPHQLSGGMRQRALIAMTLAPGPKLLIADEATTALDVHLQAQIIALLRQLSDSNDLALLLITHDLALASSLCDRIVVMYAGRVVENGPADDVLINPAMPYTEGLLASSPRLDTPPAQRLPSIPGTPVSASSRPAGCPFHDRCPSNDGTLCMTDVPRLEAVSSGHDTACHHPRGVNSPPTFRFVTDVHVPVITRDPDEPSASSILTVEGVTRRFSVGRGRTRHTTTATNDVSFDVGAGECIGVVGESGSGKTTLLRCIAGLTSPTSGRVLVNGRDVSAVSRREMRKVVRRDLQVVFQDTSASLDPRLKVKTIIAEAAKVHGLTSGVSRSDREASIASVLQDVGLSRDHMAARPGQLSGGERQRVAIARALIVRPKLLLLDEPVSALDVSLRAGILNLLAQIRDDFGLAMVFVSHDLATVRVLCQNLIVMSGGVVVESGPTDRVLTDPQDPYTSSLLAATPVLRTSRFGPDPDRKVLLAADATGMTARDRPDRQEETA